MKVLVVEGGAMRSVFSAGLLDGFLEREFNPFDAYIGVSAGAGNLVHYLAGLKGKSLAMFLDLARHGSFINPARFMKGGHLIDLEQLFAQIDESGFDVSGVYRLGKPLLVGVTDVATGKAVYLDTTPDNLMPSLMASMALPLMVRDFPLIDGRAMADGGVADAIPVNEAIRRGANHIMVVRSRHAGYVKRDTPVHRFIRWRMARYPNLRRAMKGRVRKHQDVTTLLQSPPDGVRIVDVCPPMDFRMGRFSRRTDELTHGYRAGLSMAEQVIERWNTKGC